MLDLCFRYFQLLVDEEKYLSNKEMDKLQSKVDKILEDAREKVIDVSFEFDRNESIEGTYMDVINKRKEFAYMGDIVRKLDKEYQEKSQQKEFENIDVLVSKAVDNKLVVKIENVDKNSLKPLVDRLADHLPEGFVFVANVMDSKVTFIAKSNAKEYHAGNICKAAAMVAGGNGGGRPDMAQAGGKDPSKIGEALEKAKDYIA